MTGRADDVARGADPTRRARRRMTLTLMAGVALGSTGNIAASTVATIVARDIADTAAWSGAPGASVVLGSAAGSALLAAVMVRRGRRAGLTLGYLVGLAGAILAVAAVVDRSLPLLLAGTVLIGFGNSANQLSRYAAADMYGPSQRAAAIATVVWGATVGAIIGPNLVGPAGPLAVAVGLPQLAGAYLVPALFVGAAALLSFALLRPDPHLLAARDVATRAVAEAEAVALGHAADAPARSLDALLRRPTVAAAVVALIVGQIVMTLIMTMTPLHMAEHGHDLGAVGVVISGHVVGMYGLSPISGRLSDRLGSPTVMLIGLSVLAAAGLLAAVAPPDGGVALFIALFLLGFGWNLGYVAGSSLLARGLERAQRTRLEGITDALIWSSAAGAALTSGVVVAAASYTALGLISAALVVGPAWLVIARRRALGAPRDTAAPA